MKKIVKISIFIAILALIGLLVFLGYKYYFSEDQSVGYYDFEKSDLQEEIVDGNRILKEKNLNITMQIPEDWEYILYYDGIGFKDPKMNVESPLKDFKEWTSGCALVLVVDHKDKLSYEEELEKIKSFDIGDGFCYFNHECEKININGIQGIKDVLSFDKIDFDGKLEYVEITLLDEKQKRSIKVNGILSTQVPQCKDRLNQFVNTLKFN